MMEIGALFVSLGFAVALDYVKVQSIFLPVSVCGILITFLNRLYIMVISNIAEN